MSDIMCSKCGENSYYKSGKANGKQRYKCKECGYHFTKKDRREKYSTKQRLAAVTLFRKGLSLRSIAEVIGANNVIVLYWIRNIGKFIKNTVLSATVQSSSNPLRVKPGQKNNLEFVFFLLGIFSPVRDPRAEIRRRTSSTSSSSSSYSSPTSRRSKT